MGHTYPPPRRAQPWAYNTEVYKRRNEIERLFRRLKGFRRLFSRFDKLGLMSPLLSTSH